MTVKTEFRVYALIVLLALTGLVWGGSKSAAIRGERAERDKQIAVERTAREGAIAAERAAREEVIKRLEGEIEASRFQARLATAYAVELYATMRAAGLNPPAPPKELRDDPP